MRELKYRAYIKKLNKVIEVKSIEFSTFGKGRDFPLDYRTATSICYMWNTNGKYKTNLYANYEEFNLLEYTGLKDKNGTEIYEGDIVKVPTLCGMMNGGTEWKLCNYEVVYEKQGWRPDRLKESEIIGNIYENPELGKGNSWKK